MLTGINAFRNDMITAQWKSVSFWRSLLILLSQWNIDACKCIHFEKKSKFVLFQNNFSDK